MRSVRLRWLLVGGALLAVAGCATGEEWATWKAHPTHFASGEHLVDGHTQRIVGDFARAKFLRWFIKNVGKKKTKDGSGGGSKESDEGAPSR